MVLTRFTPLCSMLQLLLVATAAQLQDNTSFSRRSSSEVLRNMIVVGPYVVVGSSTAVYALNSSLAQTGAVNLASPNLLLLANYSSNQVLFCGNANCSLSPVVALTNSSWSYSWSSTAPPAPVINTAATENVAGALASDSQGNTVVVYGVRAIESSSLPSKVEMGRIVQDSTPTYTYIGVQPENSFQSVRVFLTSFNYNNFVYFVFQLYSSTSSTYQTRVARVCGNDTGNVIPGEDIPRFSYYEVELRRQGSPASSMATAALFLPSSSAFNNDPTIIVSLLISESNYFCSYSLTAINNAMNQKFNQCVNGIGSAGLVRTRDTSTMCTILPGNTGLGICNFKNFFLKGLEVDVLLSFSAIAMATGSTPVSSLTTTDVDNRTMMFAGRADGSLATFYISNASYATFVRQVSLLIPSDPSLTSVTSLATSRTGDYIFALTPGQLFRQPVIVCGSYLTCSDCATSSDPICGWCSLTRMCVRSKDCSSDPDLGRGIWVQQPALCPSITAINPTIIYVPSGLQIPRTITLSISNVPLLMYSCVYSYSTVAMVTMGTTLSNNSVICSTPNLSSISIPPSQDALVTQVSLQRNGVNFVTLQNASLSFTNCSRNTGCVSCTLKQECMWCLNNFVCVTPSQSASCSVNPAGGQTFLDVCPSLLNGFYLLPVAVTRPLVLNTNNLPLISGYTYTCRIALPSGPISLPTNYSSNTSISCLYTAAQISLPVGTSAMVANISLIWTNSGTVMYPIDPLGVIQVTLYSCSAFSVTSCTSCLAVNIGTGYGCGWCGGTSRCVETETCTSPLTFANQSNQCPSPVLISVSPSSGPFGGGTRLTIRGTDLGVTVGDIVSVTVGGVNCSVQSDGYIAGAQFVCVTGSYTSGGTQRSSVTMRSGFMATILSSFQYTHVNPSILSVFPRSGPMAGGTNVTIGGMFLNVGNGVKRVLLNGTMCVILQSSLTQVTCTSSAQNVIGVGMVTVYIDNQVTINNAVTFEYTNNPNYTSVPVRTIPAGGIILTFTGTYLNVSQKALLVINGMAGPFPCNQTFTTLKCYAPPLGSNPIGSSLSPGVNYTIVMDGAPGPNMPIEVVPNPVFTSINPDDLMQTIGSARTIRIIGMNIKNVDVLSEIMVTVGGERCTIDLGTTTDTALSCQPPQNLSTVSSTSSKKRQSSSYSNGKVVVAVGRFLSYTPGSIIFVSNNDNVASFPISAVAGGVAGGGVGLILLLVLVVVIIVVVSRRDSVRKRQQVSALMMQMETLESNMAEECKRAFTELQTELQDVVNVHDKNYPYRDFRSFAMKFLFPTAEDDHPILKPVQFPVCVSEKEAMKCLENFRELIQNKQVLLTMIHTLESQHGRFNMRDRCNVASLLMVALQEDLHYATEILQALLTDHVRTVATKSNPRLLFRSTGTVAEKMLSNWLCFLLHPYIQEHAGEPLFALFRAIKSQLEKGPVDAITGEARNSLSEEKLLRQHLDVNVVEGVVENENEVIPIKLLDTDTISQAKEKILDALYKNTPVSRRPQLGEVDLELRRDTGKVDLELRRDTGAALLCDYDSSNTRSGEWVKVNTLGHYKLGCRSHSGNETLRFKLAPQHSDHAVDTVSKFNLAVLGTSDVRVSSTSSLLHYEEGCRGKEDVRSFHLVRPFDMSSVSSSNDPQGHKIMSEVFLTRLLATKRILQPYVDDLIKVVFSSSSEKPVPKAIKYLFDFLDLQAADMGISDPDVLHTWKTNSLFLRFWVNVIKNPEFVFDIHKSATVDSCLSVISQAYIDACSTSEAKYTKDTPSSKLLYVNEVRQYKNDIRRFYNTVQSSPRPDNQEMDEYFRAAIQPAQAIFSTDAALYELFKYTVQYSDDTIAALREHDLSDQALLFQTIAETLK